MATKRRTTTRSTKTSDGTATASAVRSLERRAKRLAAELEAERARHVRQLEHVRRAANRKLAVMMQEIATLRHHEARAEALERLLAARETPATITKGSSNGEDTRLPG